MKDVGITLILVGIAIAVSLHRRLGQEKDLVIATVRAIVQLVAVASVIDLVFESVGLSGLVLLVMVVAAALTSAHRLKGVRKAPIVAGIAICVASGIAILILFGLDVFPMTPRYLVPISGMLIGNCMVAASLAGSRVRDDLTQKTLEIEARLALGVRAADALSPYVRTASSTSLIPTIDMTKNVGLIVLPGAFVGMILGGASPLQAAKVQLIVLFMLLGAVSVAGMLASLLVARTFLGPGERIVIPPDAAR